MNLGGYLAILRRWWWTLLMATWVAGIAGYLIASGITPVYESRARIIVGPVAADIDTQRAAVSLIPTFAELATSDPLLTQVSTDLGLDVPLGELKKRVSASANQTTRVLTIRVEDTDPAAAASVANAIGSHLDALVPAAINLPEGELTTIEPAQVPTEPIAPEISLLVGLAAMAGLVGALLLVLLVEYFSDVVRDRSDITAVTDAPILGQVRMPIGFHEHSDQPLFVEASPDSRPANALRMIGLKVALERRPEPTRSILFVGTEDEPGAGELAANLAAVIRRSGRSVTLIDVNESSAEMTAMLTVRDRPGITQLLGPSVDAGRQPSTIDGLVLQRSPGIQFIPRGAQTVHLSNAEAARALMDELTKRADTVIANAAPVPRGGSALVWARVCDAVVLVVRRDQTKREALQQTLESLRLIDARLAGIVLLERGSRLAVGGPRTAQGSAAPVTSAATVRERLRTVDPIGAAAVPAAAAAERHVGVSSAPTPLPTNPIISSGEARPAFTQASSAKESTTSAESAPGAKEPTSVPRNLERSARSSRARGGRGRSE